MRFPEGSTWQAGIRGCQLIQIYNNGEQPPPANMSGRKQNSVKCEMRIIIIPCYLAQSFLLHVSIAGFSMTQQNIKYDKNIEIKIHLKIHLVVHTVIHVHVYV